jgi:hypothetical protein
VTSVAGFSNVADRDVIAFDELRRIDPSGLSAQPRTSVGVA